MVEYKVFHRTFHLMDVNRPLDNSGNRHKDPQTVSACRSGHELELTTSRVIRGQDDKVIHYLNPDQTNGFRSVLSDYFNHNAIRPLKSDMHN